MVVTTSYPPQTAQGVVTSWLPLTTIFTPSPGCESSFIFSESSLTAYDPRYGLSVDKDVKCLPSVVTQWEQTPQFVISKTQTLQSIMPMVCPSGWQTMAFSIREETSTLAMCCPSGYYLANARSGEVVGNCASTVTSGATLSYASTPNDEVNFNSWVAGELVLKEATTVRAAPIIGWNIGSPGESPPSVPPISFPSSSSTSTTTTTKASTPSSDTSTLPLLPEKAPGGLSTGAKAGIGVGATVGGIGLIVLLILCIICRRPQVPPPRARTTRPPPAESIKEEEPVLPTHEIEGRNRGHELQAQTTGHELPADRGGEMAGEERLPPYEPPAELP